MNKIKKVTVHAGHNKNGKIACGASDYIDESKEARIICKKVVAGLKKNKISALDCTVNDGTSQNDVLRKICTKCNAQSNVDLNISIHFNACVHSTKDGKTKGVEVLSLNTDTDNIRGNVSKRVCNQISKIGFTNRGSKKNTGLYFLNHTKAPAILIEVCFVDDFDDAALYKSNKQKVADTIVQAILNYNKKAK